MFDKAEAVGVKHMVYHTFRWVPNFRYLKQLVDEGYVGQMNQGLIRYMGGYGRSSQYAWRFDGERANGILGDLGSHMIDLARWYIGDIACVSAVIDNFYERQHDDGTPVKTSNDAVTLSLSFVSGAQASIQVSAAAYLAERNMHQETCLYGADGTLETSFFLGLPQFAVRGARHDAARFTDLPIPEHLLKGINADNFMGISVEQSVGSRYFVDCILDDRMPEPNLYDGYKIQQVIDAALESHQTGRRVTIE
jgi:predicted dehydrogenase